MIRLWKSSVYHISYVFTYMMVLLIILTNSRAKQSDTYKMLYRGGKYNYTNFRIYMEDFKSIDKFNHNVILYLPIAMVFCMVMAVITY